MPLVALFEGARLDATAVAAEQWDQAHRRAAQLVCPECGGRMVAAVSPRGMRHFRHYRRPDYCTSAGETAVHLEVKRRVVDAVRALSGWTAEPEVSGQGWRADVLATGPDGQWVAFEVQRSSIGRDIAEERTRRLAASGVAVCWLALTQRRALSGLPGVVVDQEEGFAVIAGACGFRWSGGCQPPKWSPVAAELELFVREVCTGSVRWVTGAPFADGPVWATAQHIAAAGAAERRWPDVQREVREREEAHERALAERLAAMRARLSPEQRAVIERRDAAREHLAKLRSAWQQGKATY